MWLKSDKKYYKLQNCDITLTKSSKNDKNDTNTAFYYDFIFMI